MVQLKDKILMFIMALYPILDIYCLPFGPNISIGTYSILLLFILFVLDGERDILGHLPKGFALLWAYIAIHGYVESITNFKIASLLPGGLNFVLWVVMFSFCYRRFNLPIFRKFYRWIFIICSVLLIIQEILRIGTGMRLILLLPLPLVDGLPTDLLYLIQSNLDRSCSLFREPSHFAIFSLPLLAIELFYGDSNKWLSWMSLFIIVTLFVLRSGNGFLGAFVLILIRTLLYFNKASLAQKAFMILVLLPISYFAISQYTNSELGQTVVDRVDNIGTSDESTSYDRLIRGFELYGKLPFGNKIIGIPKDKISYYISSSGMSQAFTKNVINDKEDTYLNGISTILVYYGIIGMLLFVFIYINVIRNNTIMGTSQIILFLLLMFVGQSFLSFFMLLTLIIAMKNKDTIESGYC